MKVKVPFFSKRILKSFSVIATWILSLFSVFAIFVSFEGKCKWWALAALIGINIITYVLTWFYCNRIKTVSLKIRKTKIIIKEGDLFNESGKRVIAFNEYFDTQVDDVVIAKGSLNGIFIDKHIKNISAFDSHIRNYLSSKTPKFVDEQRGMGKKESYDLGTIVPYDEYLLLAYSRFDQNNRAYLTKEDISKLYLNMWNEIDIVKAYNSIAMPVLGSSGIVRNMNLTPQQLVELILWSFRISGINLTRLATLTIVVHKTMTDDIDFLKLKDYSD